MPGAIDALRNALGGINPNGFTNPDGTCFLCAIETADVLMTGRAAVPVNGGDDTLNYPIHESFQSGNQRGLRVYQWLIARPPGVYAVDADDHSYNFAKTSNGGLFLIDSNQQVYRKILNYGDFTAFGHNDDETDVYRYHYTNPSDVANLTIYYCGRLNPMWDRRLAGVRTRSSSFSGSS